MLSGYLPVLVSGSRFWIHRRLLIHVVSRYFLVLINFVRFWNNSQFSSQEYWKFKKKTAIARRPFPDLRDIIETYVAMRIREKSRELSDVHISSWKIVCQNKTRYVRDRSGIGPGRISNWVRFTWFLDPPWCSEVSESTSIQSRSCWWVIPWSEAIAELF